jgi:hypothetical protein
MKKCAKCKQMKPSESFYKDKAQRSGLTTSCKACLYNAKPTTEVPAVKEKLCPDCGKLRPAAEFRRYVRSRDGLQGYCKEHENERKNASKYKISISDYRKLLESGCEVCGSFKKLCIDHDHSCCAGKYPCGKCNRGVLCHSCNFIEGRVQSIAQLDSLKNYMLKHGLF